jgi:hypothetical protein
MSITKRLTIENGNLDGERDMGAFDDEAIAAGLKRVRAEGDQPRRKGILDSEGNLLLEALPADMQEGADRFRRLMDFAENVFNADDRAARLNAGSYQNIPLKLRALPPAVDIPLADEDSPPQLAHLSIVKN